MKSGFKFRSGKHKDKTYEWVVDNDPLYLEWVSENRPEMLKEYNPSGAKNENKKTPKITNVKEETKLAAIQPNDNFDNEAPSPVSIPYMLDHVELYEEKLFKFYKSNKKLYSELKREHEKSSNKN